MDKACSFIFNDKPLKFPPSVNRKRLKELIKIVLKPGNKELLAMIVGNANQIASQEVLKGAGNEVNKELN